MKRNLFWFVVILIVFGGLYLLSQLSFTTEVVREEVIELIEEEDKYGNLDRMIETAQGEAEVEISVKVEEYRQQLLKEVEDEVKAQYITDLESTISSEEY